MRWQPRLVHGLDRFPTLSVTLRARYGGSREPEIDLLHRLVGPGDTAVDVGAHRGVYTWHLARLVGPRGSVVAFEPQPELAAYLRRAFGGTCQVRVDPSALSDGAGAARLTIPVWGARRMTGHATLEPGVGADVTVARRTLDSFALAPAFMKLDVEGHEAAVLSGARETIERHHPALLVEINPSAPIRSREQIVELTARHGYRAAFLASTGELRPVEARRLLVPGDVVDRGRYVYNYLFT